MFNYLSIIRARRFLRSMSSGAGGVLRRFAAGKPLPAAAAVNLSMLRAVPREQLVCAENAVVGVDVGKETPTGASVFPETAKKKFGHGKKTK